MNTDIKNHNRFIRFTGITAVIVFGILSVLGSGGGGDDEGGGDTGTGGLLPLYGFEIIGLSATDGYPGVTVSFESNTVRAAPNRLYGTYSCDTVSGECRLAKISRTSLVQMFDVSGTAFGDFDINVMTDITFSAGDLPTSGSYEVSQPTGLGSIVVTVTGCNNGSGDVEIAINAELPTCYTWSEFEQLDNSLIEEEQLANFAFGTFGFFFEQSNLVISSFDLIDLITPPLNTVPVDCDSFSAAGFPTPPPRAPAVLDQGSLLFSWFDDLPDGNVGPGDSFQTNFTDCWINDPTDDVDALLNGIFDLVSYTEVVDGNDLITRIGFEGTTGNPVKVGGVFYTDFVFAETSVHGPQDIQIDSSVTINGGYSIVFFQP